MQKISSFLVLFMALFVSEVYGQASSKCNNSQNIPTIVQDPTVLIGCNPLPDGLWKVYIKDSIKWEPYNILGLKNYINNQETDPTVSPVIKAITSTQIGNWNTTFSWGNHANAGYLTPTSTAVLTNKSGNISQWTNDTGYLTGITSAQINTALGYTPGTVYSITAGSGLTGGTITGTGTIGLNLATQTSLSLAYSALQNGDNISELSNDVGYVETSSLSPVSFSGAYSDLTGAPDYYLASNPAGYISGINSVQVTTALGYTPVNPNGTASQYIAGDGTKVNFPTLFSGVYNDLTDKPVIPTNTNQLVNGNGFITASSTNTLTNKSGNISQWTNDSNYLTTVPAQSWASITGKPTTAAGYGLTDVYLASNPSGYISGITSAMVNSALGYTPVNPNGTSAQYIAGDGSKVTFPAIPSTTSQISEGTNLYYTQARFNTAFAAKTTTDLAEGTNQYFTNARARGAITLTTTGTSGNASYNSSTGVLNIPNYATSTYTAGDGITIASGVISQTTPTYNNNPGRTLTTSFRPSTTRPTRVSYTVSITTALSLLNLNSAGSVALQISPDNTNWTTINSAGISRTLSVSITIGLNDTNILNIQGEIPAGYYCRLLPTTSGSSTIVVSGGQEVTY